MARRLVLSLVLALTSARGSLAQGRRCADADLSGVRVRYCTGGSGKVTVVFEAGAEGRLATWDSIVPAVEKFARVVTYDRAGHGASGAAPGSRAPAAVAGELGLLLDRIGARPPFVIVAAGPGSYYARAVALGRPDSVVGLVLIDPPSPGFDARRAAMLPPAEGRIVDSSRARSRAALDSVARREAAALDSVPAGYWEPPAGIPVTVLGAGRHEWPAGTGAEMQELLWRDSQRTIARIGTPGEWTLVEGTGEAGVLARADTVVAAIHRVVELVPSPRASWLRRLDDLLDFLPDLRNVRGLVIAGFSLLLGSLLLPYGLNVHNANKARKRKAEEEARTAPTPDPHLVPLSRLLPGDPEPRGRAVRLVHALNQRAASL
jgi:pimeloyl-ACP methyl ester carboxylesterase